MSFNCRSIDMKINSFMCHVIVMVFNCDCIPDMDISVLIHFVSMPLHKISQCHELVIRYIWKGYLRLFITWMEFESFCILYNALPSIFLMLRDDCYSYIVLYFCVLNYIISVKYIINKNSQ